MTDKEFIEHLKRLQPELERLICRTLPVKIGAKAKALFQENFRKGGFQDGGLHVWQVTRRQLLGKGADAQRGPLLSSRQILYKSIAYEIFKRRTSVLLALDGNSAAVNMMQEAKNAKKKCRIFVNPRARMLAAKARSLRGYVTMLEGQGDAEAILSGNM